LEYHSSVVSLKGRELFNAFSISIKAASANRIAAHNAWLDAGFNVYEDSSFESALNADLREEAFFSSLFDAIDMISYEPSSAAEDAYKVIVDDYVKSKKVSSMPNNSKTRKILNRF
jgi:hypothetical protein